MQDRLKVGDHVEGPIGTRGRVVRIESHPTPCLVVEHRHGKDAWEGRYTADWFRNYKGMLKKIDAPRR